MSGFCAESAHARPLRPLENRNGVTIMYRTQKRRVTVYYRPVPDLGYYDYRCDRGQPAVAASTQSIIHFTAAVVAVSARVGAAGESGLNNSSGTLEDMPLQTVARNWSADCPSMERPDGLTGTYKVETASDTLR